MNGWTLSCIAAAMVLCYRVAFSQDQADASECFGQANLFVEAHRQWLTEDAEYGTGVLLDLRNFTCDRDDNRPKLCTNVSLANGTKLEGMNLSLANLCGANLQSANLTKANLYGASLEKADLSQAILTDAILTSANLTGATLSGTYLDGTILSKAELDSATYTPNPSKQPSSDIANVKGIKDVNIDGRNNEAGMVQLRRIFKDLGLREHERQATYAIEKYRASNDSFSGFLRRVAIGVPTGWGLWPIGAWIGIAIFALAGAVCYFIAIVIQRKHPRWRRGGIYQVRLAEHLSPEDSEMTIGAEPRADHLRPRHFLCAAPWALYFALLSCFHIGWRDLNVGLWVARIQTKEFALRGYGWVRVISGFQSLFSVYLLALWALTYFGRPFE